ncbi:hypothetical protein K1719_029968 [Acacia pycnantha]|nr:hypothetical protein K1719_029968 [Acacia pycnantha]
MISVKKLGVATVIPKFCLVVLVVACFISLYADAVLIAKSLLSSTQSNSNSRHNAEEGQDMHDRLQKVRSGIFLPTFMYHKLLHETSQESLHMHYFLQEMGRSIVYHESPSDAGRRSRLWNIEDINHVLKENKGTRKVESIVVDLHCPYETNWHPKCFSKMRNLRLLDLSRVKLAHNLNCLPRALKFLRWDCYALKSLPPFDELRELESLQLCSSSIERLWDGKPKYPMMRTIDLSHSHYLRETPDFTGTPNLEKLFLDYCGHLVQVDESVRQLKKLVELSLRHCTNLEALPTLLNMNKLEVFILGECSKLKKLPKFNKNMGMLYFLDVRKTEITEIPLSIINLQNLKYLDLSGCNKLNSIPELPPKSIIRANKDPFLASTLDLQHLIESRVSKHPSVAEVPIHIVIDSKGKEDMPPWFEQQELRHSKDDAGEVVTITADIPSDLASSDGEYWGIAVCVIFECLSEGAWRGFSMNWKFEDYPYTSDKKGGRPHRTHTNAGTQVDSTDETIHSKKTADNDDPLAQIFSFEKNQQDETEFRVYIGFFPIDREKCRQHPSGEGSQVNLTLCFPATNIGKVIIHSKETSFGDLEIVDGGWRLTQALQLQGKSLHETEIAEDILSDELPSNFEHFVGDTQSKVDRIISHSKMGLEDTCFIGIWGERGIGKTTLARLVYDEIQSKFDATCFLDNIREVSERDGIVSLQKKLLSGLRLGERDIDNSFEGAKIIRRFLCHKKVLIILDDVSQISQLENLAGNKEWFGAGSKIVITTRDKTLLKVYEQFEEYGVGRLHPDESLKLLCQEAFKKEGPQEGFWDLSQEVIKHVCGLPLVLKVLGSYLCKKDKNEWREASERLREISPTDISSQLRISYDGLENEEYKRIFLDIACFFNWEPKFKVTNMLELCGHHGTNGVEVLIEKSMLNVTRSNSDLWQNAKDDQDMLGRIQKLRREIFLPTYLYDWLLQEASKEYLYMHDLLQVMGRNIVFQESNAGGRSRLWSAGEINDVLEGNKGDGSVESIVLHIQKSFEADWHLIAFQT